MISLASCKQMKRGILFVAHVGAVATIVASLGSLYLYGGRKSQRWPIGQNSFRRDTKVPTIYSNQANYFGNWGFAPGGYYWDPNYLWRRSRGFWDTNAPACPFRSC